MVVINTLVINGKTILIPNTGSILIRPTSMVECPFFLKSNPGMETAPITTIIESLCSSSSMDLEWLGEGTVDTPYRSHSGTHFACKSAGVGLVNIVYNPDKNVFNFSSVEEAKFVKSSLMEIENCSEVLARKTDSKTVQSCFAEANSVGQEITDFKLKVISWNARSINSLQKLKFLKCFDADIYLLQEIWHPQNEFESFIGDFRFIKVRENRQAGGTLVAWKDQTLNPSRMSSDINEDSFINKYIVSSDRFVWMASVYINKGTKENFMQTMSRIQEVFLNANGLFFCSAETGTLILG